MKKLLLITLTATLIFGGFFVGVQEVSAMAISVVKNTVGGDGTFSFTGTEGIEPFEITTSGGTGNYLVNTPSSGTYTITETPADGWDTQYSFCSDIPGDGESWVCTITNTKIVTTATLTVNKILLPADDTGLFNLQIDGTTVGTGTDVGDGGTTGEIEVSVGTHMVGETAGTGSTLLGYNTVIGGDCASDGSITLAPGDNKVCTITNYKFPVLTVNKVIDGGIGSFQINVNPSSQSTTLYNNGEDSYLTHDFILPTEGTFMVTEGAQSGWQLVNVSCVYDEQSVGNIIAGGEEITVDYGDHVTCTFTNTARAVIYVNKVVVNDNGGTATPDDFSFTVQEGDALFPGTFDENGYGYVIVNGGESLVYNVTEPATTGYVATYSEGCSEILLQNGQNATCTITNNDIEVVVPVVPVVPVNPPSGGGGGGSGASGLITTPNNPPTPPVPTTPTVAGVSTQDTGTTPPPADNGPGLVITGVSTPPSGDIGNGGASTGPEITSEVEGISQITPLPTQDDNQTAALEGAPGLKKLLDWIGEYWGWLLLWILLLLIAYYLYREWKKNQQKPV